MGRHSAVRHAGQGRSLAELRDTDQWVAGSRAGTRSEADGGETAVWSIGATSDLGFAALSPERLDAEHRLAAGPLPPERPGPGETPASHEVPGPDARHREERSPGADRRDVVRLGGRDGGRSRRSRRGRGSGDSGPPSRPARLAVLSALAVLLAVGATVGGMRLVAGGSTVTAEPFWSATCADRCAGDPATDADAATTIPDGGQSPEAVPDPASTERASATPTPAARTPAPETTGRATAGARRPTLTDAASDESAPPGPGEVRLGGSAAGDDAAGAGPGSAPVEDPETYPETDAAEDVAVDGGGGLIDGSSPYPHEGARSQARTPAAADGAASAVALRFTVTSEDEDGYRAVLTLRNEGGELPRWTIELPLEGDVVAVRGARWRWHDDVLTLRSGEPLAAGAAVRIVLTVAGAAVPPEECTLSGGVCRVEAAS